MHTAELLSIQVGLPKTLRHQGFPDDADREWDSGIFKDAANGRVFVGRENLAGDGQADLRVHGGPDRAVLIFSKLHYAGWEAELGHPIPNGGFGENFTVSDLTEDEVCLGDQWSIGEVVLEVSQPRLPCFKLARRLNAEGLNVKVMHAMAGGWYCRVLQEGHVEDGQALDLQKRPHPDWTIRRAFREYIFGKQNHDALAELRDLPALSTLWKEGIQTKLEKRDA